MQTAMPMPSSSSKVSLKLFIHKSSNRVLFAEAGKDFVDFFDNNLNLPVRTLITLLKPEIMLGCLGNIHDSIINLSPADLEPDEKGSRLKPNVHFAGDIGLPRRYLNSQSSIDKKFEDTKSALVQGGLSRNIAEREMEQLKERDGAIDFFLMTAATNVDCHSGETDIQRSKLVTVANAVNFKFGTTLDSMDVKVIWAKVRVRWETWVRTKYYVRSDEVDYTIGTFQISKFIWDRLLRIVPKSEVFHRESLISPSIVCSIFNRTPSSLAPDEHLYSRRNMFSGGTSSGKRGPSLKGVKNEVIAACMRKVYAIEELANQREYINFCLTFFEDPVIREVFNYLPNKLLRREYIIKKYGECVAP